MMAVATNNITAWFNQISIIHAIAVLIICYLIFKKLFNNKTTSRIGFHAFSDKYTSLEQVTEALREAGLESSNLIIGIDFTASNETQGRKTFGGKSLHSLATSADQTPNPYQRVISIIGRTLSKFDEDGFIPCFGFGDVHTKDFDVFPISPSQLTSPSTYYQMTNGVFCNGFDQVLQVYNAITPHVRLSGPTNFAPLIKKAIEVVMQRNRPEYHILVIIADGQVVNEKETEDAIVEASNYPLSIILVGVGDGPWDTMESYDDELPARKFDNFQFVNYSKIMSSSASAQKREVEFALTALMELPDQYRAIRELNLLSATSK